MEQFKRLVEIMARLRSSDGCPWDRAQDHKSLRLYLIEEAYEVLDAIEQNNPDKLAEELGDLLLHVVFHAQIADEKGEFNIEDICHKISEKLIKRHPHVFKGKRRLSTAQVINQWEEIKRGSNSDYSILDGVPKSLPALLKAYRIQEKVGHLGFDWKDASEVILKIKEEVAEFEQASSSKNPKAMHRELGDLLFSMVNLSRHLGLQAEEALEDTNKKFIKRFQFIEKKLAESGKTPAETTLEEMDALWEESKKFLD
jgi:tetrapyrrole methylase family protein/MazG family protein